MLHTGNTGNNNEAGENCAADELSDVMQEMAAWMEQTNLPKKVKKKLMEEEVTLDVLLISDESDLRGLCKEFGMNRLSTMKLLAAVKKMPEAKLNKKSKIIIMDLQEKDAINKTEQALAILQNSLLTSQKGVETLLANAVTTEEQVRTAFVQVRQKIVEREQSLMARLEEVSKRQTKDLQNDVLRFEKYIVKVKNAVKSQNELFDLALTADARKQRVLEIKANAIEENFNYELTENDQLVFGNLFESEIFQFVNTFGLVDGCFKVRLPIISSAKIVQRNNVALAWTMTECDAEVDKYEVQHTGKRFPELSDWTVSEYKAKQKGGESSTLVKYVITRLKYSTEYFVRVRGLNKYGFGPFSEMRKMVTMDQPVPNEPVWCEDFPQLDGNLNIKLQWKVNFDEEEVKENSSSSNTEDRKSNDDEQMANNNNNSAGGKSDDKVAVQRYCDDDEIVQFEVQYADTVTNTWKAVFIDQLVDAGNQLCEHRLEKLQEKTAYKVRIRCKNRVNEWSAWSPQSTIRTLAGIQKHCIIWNEINATPPAPVHIQNGGRRVSAPDASCWETFVGSNVGISEGKHTWKVKWTKFGGSYQAVGIVTNVQCVHTKQTNHRFNNDNTPYGEAYYWHRDHKKIAYGKSGNETDLKTSLPQWAVGIVTIFLDLEANQIRFDHNNTEIGTYDIKPDLTWYPLVLLCTCGNECESVPISEW